MEKSVNFSAGTLSTFFLQTESYYFCKANPRWAPCMDLLGSCIIGFLAKLQQVPNRKSPFGLQDGLFYDEINSDLHIIVRAGL